MNLLDFILLMTFWLVLVGAFVLWESKESRRREELHRENIDLHKQWLEELKKAKGWEDDE